MPCLLNSDGSMSPPTLLELCIQCVARHLPEMPQPLHLPAEVTGRVLVHCASRSWLDLDTLHCLRECPIVSLELPSNAMVDASWSPMLCAHSELVRLDLSGAPSLTDAAVSHLSKALLLLRELNLSGCSALSDAALGHISSLGALQLLKAEALPRVTDAGVAKLERLHSLCWLSLAGCSATKSGSLASISRLGSQMRYLSLQKCSGADDAGLQHITAALTELRTVRTLASGCPNARCFLAYHRVTLHTTV